MKVSLPPADEMSIRGLIEETWLGQMDVFVALGRSESTGYTLRKDPKKRFNLTVDDWKPETVRKKKQGRKPSTQHFRRT